MEAGQAATFQVDAFPGRTFPARVQRVDVGANAGSATTSTTSSSASNTVVSYTAVLAVDNPDGTLRPGMTATAEVVTSEKHGVLLVPNAALRFSPDAAKDSGGDRSAVTKVLMPPRPRGTAGSREVSIGRGSSQSVYVLGPDGEPQRTSVKTGDTNGTDDILVRDRVAGRTTRVSVGPGDAQSAVTVPGRSRGEAIAMSLRWTTRARRSASRPSARDAMTT